VTPDLAHAVEDLGYGALWIGGSPPADLTVAEQALEATTHLVVATGIVNVWRADPREVARSFHRMAEHHPARFLLGIGVGHPEATSTYEKPYEAVVAYLDELDRERVPWRDMALAALGPRMLRLAAGRTAGAHPYLTTPEHTRRARQIIGTDALLAPEQHVVLDTDADRARATARENLVGYLDRVNYRQSWARLGFTDDDMAGEGSDPLVDALVAHGDAEAVAERVREHLDAGADHVCVQVLGPHDGDLVGPLRELARLLID
jgi:probable F420-dependent oxidoreductase